MVLVESSKHQFAMRKREREREREREKKREKEKERTYTDSQWLCVIRYDSLAMCCDAGVSLLAG